MAVLTVLLNNENACFVGKKLTSHTHQLWCWKNMGFELCKQVPQKGSSVCPLKTPLVDVIILSAYKTKTPSCLCVVNDAAVVLA